MWTGARDSLKMNSANEMVDIGETGRLIEEHVHEYA